MARRDQASNKQRQWLWYVMRVCSAKYYFKLIGIILQGHQENRKSYTRQLLFKLEISSLHTVVRFEPQRQHLLLLTNRTAARVTKIAAYLPLTLASKLTA